MRKGKFGIVLCAYPILAFVCVVLNQPLLCALIFALALLAERDEWAGRQTLQALGLAIVSRLVQEVLRFVADLFPVYWDFFHLLSTVLYFLAALVYLAAIILSIIAILRVMKEREADLPLLSSLAYRAYGRQRPRPFPGQYPPPYNGPQQGPPPYHPPYGDPGQTPPPYSGPGQGTTPSNNGPQQPGGPQQP